jgi:hypothetical protein
MLALSDKSQQLIIMNAQAREVLARLKQAFPDKNNNEKLISDKSCWQSLCPIGIEIEVKWRYYFPQLWDKYLAHTSYKNLEASLEQDLTNECCKIEETLLPRLEKTRECGVEKGQDKYYEFAFNPVTDIYVLTNQVQILQQENLIPQGTHSLHLTVGNLKAIKDVYYLLLFLEMLYCNQERVASAFHQDNSKISSTWARKGMGGVFNKESHELKFDYEQAVELRTLQITEQTDLLTLLCQCSILSDIIYCKMTHQNHPLIEQWDNWLNQIQLLLQNMGLTDNNWKKPNLTPQYWLAYMDAFTQLQQTIIPLSQKLLPFLFKSFNPEK